MADGRVEANADVNQEILKAAQQEISSVLTNAMGNMTPVSNDSGKPESAKQHSTAEEQVPGSEYVQPMQDPYNKAIKYLENHNILQLFQVNHGSFEHVIFLTNQGSFIHISRD